MIAAIVLAAAAAAGASSAEPSPASRVPIAQATATVRIVQGERITADKLPETAMVVETRLRGSDGIERAVRLVEFP